MHKTSRAMRSVTFAAIFGLALTTGAVGAPVASAQLSDAASAATIDASKTATLTIHKKADATSEGTPTGNNDYDGDGKPLNGATFEVKKIETFNGVKLDLTTNEGLAAAAGLTKDVLPELLKKDPTPFTFGKTEAGTTQGGSDEDPVGEAVFDKLALGVYLVTETQSPDGYAPAAPFLAFLPMTKDNAGNGGTEWNYDVHAYPKNYKNELVKEVIDADKNVGDTVEFKVTANVPKTGDKGKVTKFHIVDDIELEQTDSAGVKSVTIEGLADPLVEGTDYEVLDESKVTLGEGEAAKEYRHLEIKFLAEGLTKLEQNQGKKVVATFTAKIAKVGETDGALHNVAKSISNNGNGGGDVETPSTPTDSFWGKVRINKVDADPEKDEDGKPKTDSDGKPIHKPLAGAVFEAYMPGENGKCGDDKKALGKQIKIGNESSWITDEKGEAVIDGLHVTDFENNAEGINKVYCLVETVAPKDYELLAKPIEITLKREELKKVGDDVKQVSMVKTIENLKDTTPNLPLTGGAGIGILAAIGAALVGLGAWFARRNSKES